MCPGRCSGEDACDVPFEEYVEDNDNDSPYTVQKTVLKNTETGAEEGEAAVCKPIPKCCEAIQCFSMYHHFLTSVSDVPEHIVRN